MDVKEVNDGSMDKVVEVEAIDGTEIVNGVTVESSGSAVDGEQIEEVVKEIVIPSGESEAVEAEMEALKSEVTQAVPEEVLGTGTVEVVDVEETLQSNDIAISEEKAAVVVSVVPPATTENVTSSVEELERVALALAPVVGTAVVVEQEEGEEEVVAAISPAVISIGEDVVTTEGLEDEVLTVTPEETVCVVEKTVEVVVAKDGVEPVVEPVEVVVAKDGVEPVVEPVEGVSCDEDIAVVQAAAAVEERVTASEEMVASVVMDDAAGETAPLAEIETPDITGASVSITQPPVEFVEEPATDLVNITPKPIAVEAEEVVLSGTDVEGNGISAVGDATAEIRDIEEERKMNLPKEVEEFLAEDSEEVNVLEEMSEATKASYAGDSNRDEGSAPVVVDVEISPPKGFTGIVASADVAVKEREEEESKLCTIVDEVETEFSAKHAKRVIEKGVVVERKSSISRIVPMLKKQGSMSAEDASKAIEEGFISDRRRLLKESEEEVRARHATDRQDRDLYALTADTARKGSVKGRAEMFSKAVEELKEGSVPKVMPPRARSQGKLSKDWTKRKEELEEHVITFEPPILKNYIPPPPMPEPTKTAVVDELPQDVIGNEVAENNHVVDEKGTVEEGVTERTGEENGENAKVDEEEEEEENNVSAVDSSKERAVEENLQGEEEVKVEPTGRVPTGPSEEVHATEGLVKPGSKAMKPGGGEKVALPAVLDFTVAPREETTSVKRSSARGCCSIS